MKANQNTTSTIAEKDAGLAQGTLLHPAKPSGDGSFVRDAVVNRPNNQWRLTARQEPFAAVEVKVRLADIALVRCGYPKFRFAFTLRCL
jgi:hypothetical protein